MLLEAVGGIAEVTMYQRGGDTRGGKRTTRSEAMKRKRPKARTAAESPRATMPVVTAHRLGRA